MYEIKMNDTHNNTNILEVLKNSVDFNKYIEDNVKDASQWIIFANTNYFKENKIEDYKEIKIKYNDFMLTDNVIILYKKEHYSKMEE